MGRKWYWKDLYRTTAAEELGWYQVRHTMSLHLIESTGMQKTESLIDVGGDDSTLVEHLLDQDFTHLTQTPIHP